jgi:hypothetical protein
MNTRGTETAFHQMMLNNACTHNFMPEEIFSKKNRMADNGMLYKTLFDNIAWQAHVPAAIASVNASNCNNRIAHPMVSLIFQAFGVPMSALESMLGAIKNMKFFLRMGFRDLTSFVGGKISIKTQSLCKGNGASPAGWAVISICILKAHGRKGHGVQFLCPITHLQHHLSAILYVDNTDLLHIDLTKNKSVNDVHMAIQDSVNSWGNLLIATGGVLQPAKCFSSIIFFECINREWHYAMNANRGDFGILVPLTGGSNAMISHKPVNHAEKTLVAMTSLDGNSCAAICMMQEKAQQWINAIRNGHLHCQNVWFLLKVQFFPHVCHSLCSSTATFKELEQALHHQYYQILPLGGVVRTTTIRSRTMDAGFYGIGLLHLGVKALVAMSNKLFMHYGYQTATGRFMQTSLSLLFVELGLLFQPLQESYERFGFLPTHSWFKML